MKKYIIITLLFCSTGLYAQMKYNWDSTIIAGYKDSITFCGRSTFSTERITINGKDAYYEIRKLIDMSKLIDLEGLSCVYNYQLNVNCKGEVYIRPLRPDSKFGEPFGSGPTCEEVAMYIYTQLRNIKFDAPKDESGLLNIKKYLTITFNGRQISLSYARIGP